MILETEIDTERLGTLEPFSGHPLNIPLNDLYEVAVNFLDAHFYEEGDEEVLKSIAQAKKDGRIVPADELAVMRSAKSRLDSRGKVAKAFKAIKEGKLLGILPDGTVRVQGSAVYLVGADCTIEGRYTTNKKTGKHGPAYCPTYTGGKQGACYHCWIREVVRIAQVIYLGC